MKKLAAALMAGIMTVSLMGTLPAHAENNYYTLQEEIVLPDGGYNINTDYIGLKTIYVNIALRESSNARYSGETVSAVKKFQEEYGLPVTGEVDLATWCAIGENLDVNFYSWPVIEFNEESWYGIGTYVTPMKVTKYSKREDIVNAICTTAAEYEGTPYRIGSSGIPGQAADCSGLVFQCLYAAGINPEKNIVDHALAIYEYTSRNLCADSMLGDYISTSEIQAGDLIYYQHNGVVCHVGVCVSSTMMYDAWPEIGTTYRAWSKGGSVYKVQRVLPNYDETVGEIPENAVTAINSKTGSDCMALYDIAGQNISSKIQGISIIVNSSGIVETITLSKDITVPEGGYVLNATGTHGDWVLNTVKKGDRIWIDDDLVLTASAEYNVITGTNRERKAGDLIQYTEGTSTGTNADGAEIAVDADGTIVSVVEGKGNTTIPEGGYVLSGNGLSAEWLMINVTEGCIVSINNGSISVSQPVIEAEPAQPCILPIDTNTNKKLIGLNYFIANNFFIK